MVGCPPPFTSDLVTATCPLERPTNFLADAPNLPHHHTPHWYRHLTRLHSWQTSSMHPTGKLSCIILSLLAIPELLCSYVLTELHYFKLIKIEVRKNSSKLSIQIYTVIIEMVFFPNFKLPGGNM